MCIYQTEQFVFVTMNTHLQCMCSFGLHDHRPWNSLADFEDKYYPLVKNTITAFLNIELRQFYLNKSRNSL